MKIAIHINSTTVINIETYKIMERELESYEPIWDPNSKKMNYKIFSFYFIIRVNDSDNENICYNLFEAIRLYSRCIELKTKTKGGYVLFRSVSDDIQVVENAVKKLISKPIYQGFEVINQNVEIFQLNEFDEYNLGRFLDTQIDKAMLPFS